MSEPDERRVSPPDSSPAPVPEDGPPSESGWPAPRELRSAPPPAPPFSWPLPGELEPPKHEFHHPLDRVTGRLPRRVRIAVDWIVTIVGAVAIVLAIKAWVVNPYRIPSSSMEPTLHCARPATGCESRFSDRVLANRFIYHFSDPQRGDVVVFDVPPAAEAKCGAGGTFVKRIVGLPGETLQLRLIRSLEFVYIDGRKLQEPYVQPKRRGFGPEQKWKIPEDQYFVMGDNRSQSCDSTEWGPVARENLIGKVFLTYWPPQRISFR